MRRVPRALQRAASRLRLGSGELFLWLLPLIVVFELVGGPFDAPIVATLLYFSLFAGALWLSRPAWDGQRIEHPRLRLVFRIFGGVSCAGAALVLSFALARMLDSKATSEWTLLAPELASREWTILVPVLACYPLALGVPLLLGRQLAGRDYERFGLFVALVFVALLSDELRTQGLPVLAYSNPATGWVLGACAAMLGALCLLPRPGPAGRLALLVLAAVSLRVIGLGAWNIDPAVRDMLALVTSAQDAFARGDNPYAIYQMQRGSEVPLTYLPGMWLLHGIPRLFGLDLRFTGVVMDAVVAGSVYWAANGVAGSWRERARGVAAGFAAVWLFSPSVHWNGVYAEPHVWWGVLAVLLAALVRRRFWLACAVLGLALATRQFALVVAPFAVLHVVRVLGFRQALPRLGVTGLVAACLLLPFVVRDPEMFWFGTYRWLLEYGPAHDSWFFTHLGFSGTLYREGLSEWMPRAQLAAVLAMLLVATFLRGPRAFLAPAGTAYVLFVMFNGIIWDSFYLGAALFAAFAAAAGYVSLPETTEPARSARRAIYWPLTAACIGSVFVAGWLLYSLALTLDFRGRGEARRFLEENLRPGDAVVDRSDWRLAFVKGTFVLDRSSLRTPVGYEPFDRRFGESGAVASERSWLLTRRGRDADLRKQFSNLGSPFIEREIGRYQILGVRTRRAIGSLSRAAGELRASLKTADAGAPELLEPTGAGELQLIRSSSYTAVSARGCRVHGFQRKMLHAYLGTAGSLRVKALPPSAGDRLLLLASVGEHGASWNKAGIAVSVVLGGRPLGELVVQHRPAMFWKAFEVAPAAPGPTNLEVVIETREDRRSVCVDVVYLESR